jgi:hypothetical protein
MGLPCYTLLAALEIKEITLEAVSRASKIPAEGVPLL